MIDYARHQLTVNPGQDSTGGDHTPETFPFAQFDMTNGRPAFTPQDLDTPHVVSVGAHSCNHKTDLVRCKQDEVVYCRAVGVPNGCRCQEFVLISARWMLELQLPSNHNAVLKCCWWLELCLMQCAAHVLNVVDATSSMTDSSGVNSKLVGVTRSWGAIANDRVFLCGTPSVFEVIYSARLRVLCSCDTTMKDSREVLAALSRNLPEGERRTLIIPGIEGEQVDILVELSHVSWPHTLYLLNFGRFVEAVVARVLFLSGCERDHCGLFDSNRLLHNQYARRTETCEDPSNKPWAQILARSCTCSVLRHVAISDFPVAVRRNLVGSAVTDRIRESDGAQTVAHFLGELGTERFECVQWVNLRNKVYHSKHGGA